MKQKVIVVAGISSCEKISVVVVEILAVEGMEMEVVEGIVREVVVVVMILVVEVMEMVVWWWWWWRG